MNRLQTCMDERGSRTKAAMPSDAPGRHLVAPVGRAMAQSVGPIAATAGRRHGWPDPRRCRAGGRAEARWESTKKKRNPASPRCSSMPRRTPERGALLQGCQRPEGGRRIRAASMPWGRRPNSRRCSARPTASWSRMLSSRASSGRKPWVAAEVMVSIRPRSSSDAERARRCRRRGRERAGAGGCSRPRQNSTSGIRCVLAGRGERHRRGLVAGHRAAGRRRPPSHRRRSDAPAGSRGPA